VINTARDAIATIARTGSDNIVVHLDSFHMNIEESSLREHNYTGTITFESFSSAIVAPNLSNTLAVWRNLWEDSDDLARHAKAFMDLQLASANHAVS